MLKWYILKNSRFYTATLIKFFRQKINNVIHRCLKRINLSFITPASPLTPGRFVISCWAFSPWMWDKLGSIAWNSFHWQTFPETFHTANLSDLVSTRVLEDDFSPEDLLTYFLSEAEDMVAAQTFLEVVHTICHVGATIIRWSIFSSRIFLRNRLLKLKGGKPKPYSLSQGYRNASVTILLGSGFHAMYRGSSGQSLVTPSLYIQSWTKHFETFWYFTKFSFHHKRNEAWLLVINMVYTSCLTSCRTTWVRILGN